MWQPGNFKAVVTGYQTLGFMKTCIYTECIFPSSLPGLGHHRTIGFGYTPLDQRERRPGPLVEPGHLQDLGLSHQQRMGRSGCQPDRVSTCVEREPVGSRRQHVRWCIENCDVIGTWTHVLYPDRHVEYHLVQHIFEFVQDSRRIISLICGHRKC